MYLSNMRYLLLGMMFSLPVLADGVYSDDGSLTIIESSEPTVLVIDNSGNVEVGTQLGDEPTFVYGSDELTVCQPTGQGTICY